jgi:hypothetical protein
LNDEGANDYLAVRVLLCVDRGYRDDIGATLRLLDGDGSPIGPIQEVNGGRGHGSQNPALVHLGLPRGPNVLYRVWVHFTDGQEIDVEVRPSELGTPEEPYQIIEVITPDCR